MFTGLVQQIGKFVGLRPKDGGASLSVSCPEWADDSLTLGESIAVQGCCLTVSAVLPGGGFEADVLDETLNVSALGLLKTGAKVNLERALRPSDRLGGHIVQGHIDCVATLREVISAGRDFRLVLSCPAESARFVVYKGSVALDGVSLTVSAVPSSDCFEVNIIPTTWRETSLSERKPGDKINLETDILGRYVEAFTRASAVSPAVSMDLLRRAGFAN